MARIELKNTRIFIRDGFTEVGAVNDGAGGAIGATTLTVDGFTSTLEAGMLFLVAGSDRLHRISVPTGTPTTSFTFTPALRAAVLDDAVITVSGRAIEILVGDGNLTWSEAREFSYDLDRGNLNTVRTGDEQPMEVTLDLVYEFIRSLSAGEPTVEEALKQKERAASWASASADACEPYAVEIVVEQVQPCNSIEPELSVFSPFRHESLDFDMDEATISMTGRCNAIEPTHTRLSTTP